MQLIDFDNYIKHSFRLLIRLSKNNKKMLIVISKDVFFFENFGRKIQ